MIKRNSKKIIDNVKFSISERKNPKSFDSLKSFCFSQFGFKLVCGCLWVSLFGCGLWFECVRQYFKSCLRA